MADKPKPEDEGDVAAALAALQTQLNEQKAQLLDLAARPTGAERVEIHDDALLAAADLFQSLRLSCFGSDARDAIKRVTDAAAVIRQRRASAAKGTDDA